LPIFFFNYYYYYQTFLILLYNYNNYFSSLITKWYSIVHITLNNIKLVI
jgi:hypothetical protein